MNNADKQAVLHCLKSMIDEEVCEECPLYGMTGTDHCEKDCVRLAINALEKEPLDVFNMLYDIYMSGVNMTDDYQGLWVRFKDIETIVNKYVGDAECN